MIDELALAFRASATQIGMLSASLYFVYTPMQLVVGILLDYFGARKLLILAIISCVIGNVCFTNADNLAMVYLGRGLIGFGSAFAFVGAVKLANAWLPKKYVHFFIGLATALGMLGALLQTNIIPRILHLIGWQGALRAGTIAGLVLLPISYFLLHDSPQQLQEDATQQSHNMDLTLHTAWRNLVQVAVNKRIWLSGIIASVLYLSLSMVAELWGIPALMEIYHINQIDAASCCSMIYLGWLIGGPVAGLLGTKVSIMRLLTIGLAGSAMIFTLLIYGAPFIGLFFCQVGMLLFGLLSSVQVLCFGLSNENAPTEAVATSTAFTNCIIMLGGFIAQPLIGACLDLYTRYFEPTRIATNYSANGYYWTFLLLPLSLLVGLVLTRFYDKAETV